MNKSNINYTILACAFYICLTSCKNNTDQPVFDRFKKLHTLPYSVESSKSPFVIKWKNKIHIPFNKTAELDASSFSTIWKSIKYSDESTARTILDGYFYDYCLLDIRHDRNENQLILLTSGNIWSDGFKNHYLFCYDLTQRKVLSQTIVSPVFFDKIHVPGS